MVTSAEGKVANTSMWGQAKGHFSTLNSEDLKALSGEEK